MFLFFRGNGEQNRTVRIVNVTNCQYSNTALRRSSVPSESESEYLYSVLLRNNHLPIRHHHRQSGSTAYRLQDRPAPTVPGLRLTAMPCPNLPFNGLHPRDPWNYMDHRPWRDGRLSWPSWLQWSMKPMWLLGNYTIGLPRFLAKCRTGDICMVTICVLHV